MKNTVSETNDELIEIPPFDFENSEPNKFAEYYEANAETVLKTVIPSRKYTKQFREKL